MSLHHWFGKVGQAGTRVELYAILDQFRVLSWTDNERSQMARFYIRLVENLPEGAMGKDSGSAEAACGNNLGTSNYEGNSGDKEGDDGPVWYEKM